MRSAPGMALDLATSLLNLRSVGSPAFLTWVITDQCQCRCRHCANINIPGKLTWDQRLAIAKSIAASGVRWVSLVGGEPLLEPRIAEIVGILKHSGKKVTITTNGDRLDDLAEDFLRVELDALHVSMDSHDSAVHDDLRGVPDLFDRVESAMRRIRRERRGEIPAVKVRCTISRANFRRLNAYVGYWKGRADHIHFQPVVDNVINRVREHELLFRAGDEEDFRRAIEDLQREYPEFRNRYYDLMGDYLFDTTALQRRLHYSCLLIASTAMFVFPDGSVSSCYGTMDTLTGSILDDSVATVWRSRQMMELRKWIREADDRCFCWGPNTVFDLQILRIAQLLGLSPH